MVVGPVDEVYDVYGASRDLPGGVDGVVADHYEVPAKLMTRQSLAPKT